MIEHTILRSLLCDLNYLRKVVPYIDREYFQTMGEKIIFSLIKDYYVKYNSLPTRTAIEVELRGKKMSENFFNQSMETLQSLQTIEPVDTNWLIDATENFCKRRAFFNAIVKASEFLEGDDVSLYAGAHELISDALSVSFDSDLGTDYFENAEERFDKYKQGTEQLACDIEIFNKVTKGGFVKSFFGILEAFAVNTLIHRYRDWETH